MVLRLIVVFAAAWILYEGVMWALDAADAMLPEAQAGMVKWGLLGTIVALYILFMAVPFVPGIEIGLSLLLIGGAQAAPFVYLATVLGLILAFVVGTNLPFATLHRLFADLRMRRMCRLLDEIKPLDREARLDLFSQKLPGRVSALAIRGRYLVLAALLNTPGNVVLGGGGGICLAAGVSRIFAPGPTCLVIALAVLPVPLGVWFFGMPIIPGA